MINQFNDKIHKLALRHYLNSFLKYWNINHKIKEIYTNELFFGYVQYFADTVIELENDKILNLEYHTGNLKEENLNTHLGYAVTIKKRYDKEVITIIIITGKLEKSKTELKTDQIEFKPLILSYENRNGFEKLKKLKLKIRNNQRLTETERLDLIFIPFMEDEKEIEYLIYEVIDLTNKIDYISKNEKDNIKLSQYILLNKHVENLEMKSKMKDMINMENSIFDNFFDDAIEQGLEKGMEKVAINLINKNMSIEEIAEITELPVEKVEELKNKIMS